jgi:hypothetical protein
MNADMPTITTSSYSSTAVDTLSEVAGLARAHPLPVLKPAHEAAIGHRGLHLGGFVPKEPQEARPPFDPDDYLNKEPIVSTRIVKVFIADPNENIPLDKRVLYSGPEQFTDLTDQELFFEVPITDLLAKHNEQRKATLDKKTTEKSGRDVFLEPARVRDLRMVVVNVATF